MTARPIHPAIAKAGAALAALNYPRLSPFATSDEIMSVADFLEGLIGIVDPLIAQVGADFVAAAPGGHGIRAELSHFQNQLRDALDGETMHALTRAAEISAEEYEGAF